MKGHVYVQNLQDIGYLFVVDVVEAESQRSMKSLCEDVGDLFDVDMIEVESQRSMKSLCEDVGDLVDVDVVETESQKRRTGCVYVKNLCEDVGTYVYECVLNLVVAEKCLFLGYYRIQGI